MTKEDTEDENEAFEEQAFEKREDLDEKHYMTRSGKRAMVIDAPLRMAKKLWLEYSMKRRNAKERWVFPRKNWDKAMKTANPRAERKYLSYMTRAVNPTKILHLPYLFAKRMIHLYQL